MVRDMGGKPLVTMSIMTRIKIIFHHEQYEILTISIINDVYYIISTVMGEIEMLATMTSAVLNNSFRQ